MIYGFLSPWEPLSIDFNIQNDFKKYKNEYGHVFEKYYFCKFENLKDDNLGKSAT